MALNVFPNNAFGNNIAEVAIGYKDRGILPSVLIAQAVLESNYGKSSLASKYNNPFGIKGSGTGGSVLLPTWEEVNGKVVKVNANFAVFNSINDAFDKYLSVVTRNFPSALQSKDYKEYVSALVDGNTKYATDSKYKGKVIDIIEEYNLNALDVGAVPVMKPQNGSALGGIVINPTIKAVERVTDVFGNVKNYLDEKVPKLIFIIIGLALAFLAIKYLFNDNEGE